MRERDLVGVGKGRKGKERVFFVSWALMGWDIVLLFGGFLGGGNYARGR